MPALLRKLLPALTLAAMLTACESVDDDRIPYAEVHLTFHTVGDWNIYGVQGDAASSRTYIFNSKERVPSNFPYTTCLLYTSPSPRDGATSRMTSSD